jgi:hypothetical protein
LDHDIDQLGVPVGLVQPILGLWEGGKGREEGLDYANMHGAGKKAGRRRRG